MITLTAVAVFFFCLFCGWLARRAWDLAGALVRAPRATPPALAPQVSRGPTL